MFSPWVRGAGHSHRQCLADGAGLGIEVAARDARGVAAEEHQLADRATNALPVVDIVRAIEPPGQVPGPGYDLLGQQPTRRPSYSEAG